MTIEPVFSAAISQEIWDRKYRFKRPDGSPVDAALDDTFWRVTRAAAAAEKGGRRVREKWAQRFHGAVADLGFLPAGRILAGAGTGRASRSSTVSCMGTIPDSMDGIFSALREAALTLQQGGGIGYDFSTLRPKGAPVERRRRGRLGPGLLHGRVGRDVPHHHERGHPPRRHDGDAALRPSRHRGFHRRQAHAGPAVQFQPVGAGERRLHGGGARTMPTGS